MADAHCKCAHCGAPIIPRRNLNGEASKSTKRYCSRECQRTVNGARSRNSKPRVIVCEHCHRECVRRVRGGEADSGKYCNRSCAAARRSLVAHEIARLQQMGAKLRSPKPRCLHCGALLKRHAAKYCDHVCRHAETYQPKPPEARPCTTCGAVIITTGHRKHCDTCRAQAACRQKRIARAAGKARKRGATVERVDDLLVLARDRWRCQLCGIKTPKAKRGTYEPDAPEVDHIVPLGGGHGGEHSYRNLQCLCRACNHRKGASVKGQLLLIG